MTHNQNELRALLPWYVNGTLDTAMRQDIELRLDHSPLLRGEVVWLRLLRSQIRDEMTLENNQRSETAGLDTLMALIHGEQSGKVVPLHVRIVGWVAGTRRLPLAMGIAAVVVLSQAVIIGALLDRSMPEQLMPMSGGVSAVGPLLQITFKPTATEAQIRVLLASVQGEIVAGPGALGVYAVRVPESQGTQALGTLRADVAVVDSVVLLPGR